MLTFGKPFSNLPSQISLTSLFTPSRAGLNSTGRNLGFTHLKLLSSYFRTSSCFPCGRKKDKKDLTNTNTNKPIFEHRKNRQSYIRKRKRTHLRMGFGYLAPFPILSFLPLLSVELLEKQTGSPGSGEIHKRVTQIRLLLIIRIFSEGKKKKIKSTISCVWMIKPGLERKVDVIVYVTLTCSPWEGKPNHTSTEVMSL